ATWNQHPQNIGIELLDLHHDEQEKVCMERWQPGLAVKLLSQYGLELLVTKGSYTEDGQEFEIQSWLRLPANSETEVIAGPQGCTVWIKRDHLKETPQPPQV
ncbi:MAG: cupin domain-containing protein, partial [Pseudomonadota bacterium]